MRQTLSRCDHRRLLCLRRRLASLPNPLPSWNDGGAEEVDRRLRREGHQAGLADFVPPAERIAVFDNDGTLWAEQPMYFQLAFALDRVKALAPQHPEWKTRSRSPRC